MNLKKILKLEFNSNFLRRILGLFYKDGKYYKIVFGRLKGMKLYYQHDINYHAILGLWERDSLETLLSLFSNFDLDKKKIVVADVGANMGYYSLFFSKFLYQGSKIFAFEPSVSIFDVLQKNIDANSANSVKLLDIACSDKPGEIEFYIAQHHHQSSVVPDFANNLSTGKKVIVKCTSLDDFFSKEKDTALPDLIKMDIEGGGVYALKGCAKCITEKRPFILIESHTPAEDKAVANVLTEYGYEAFKIDTKKWVSHKDGDYKDPEGVWGTMMLIPGELKNKFIV